MQLPTISIVTPSFNQAAFLGEAMDSVLGQNFPALEYVVMDGGSTDGSVEIIRSHADRLKYWISGPDGGHYAALNAGFAQTSGEVMGWLNADDKYLPGALSVVCEIFAAFPEIEWLTTAFPLRWDERGRATRCTARSGYSREGFLRGENLPGGDWFSTGWIQQESTFWRRSLWERSGATLDVSRTLAADFDLWARFFAHAPLVAVTTPLGGFRLHGDQRSGRQREDYLRQAGEVLRAAGGGPPGRWKSAVRYRALRHLHRGFPAKLVRARRDNAGWEIATVMA